jgi:hypothetical protein
LLAGIVKPVECPHQPGAHRAVVVRPERDGDGLEARAIMLLEHFHQKSGGYMLVKIGGKIGQPDFGMAIAFALPNWGKRAGPGLARIILRAAKLNFIVVQIAHQHKGLDAGFAGKDIGLEFFRQPRRALPIADGHGGVGEPA